MSLNSAENRSKITESFPGLIADERFEITSPIDTDYNCIAWAANRSNRFWWPHVPRIDGTDWPIENKSLEFNTLIEVFNSLGYTLCDDWNFEAKYKKVALYINNDTGHFTHAARQLRNGLWTSKLGPAFDITHKTPFTIEGAIYGEVRAFMAIIF